MNVKKALLVALGCIGLALGAVGAVVPRLPAFPFRMLRSEAADVLPKGQRAEPARLHASGFGFEFGTPSLEKFLCRLAK